MTGVILSTQVDLQKESQAMFGGESQATLYVCQATLCLALA